MSFIMSYFLSLLESKQHFVCMYYSGQGANVQKYRPKGHFYQHIFTTFDKASNSEKQKFLKFLKCKIPAPLEATNGIMTFQKTTPTVCYC